MPSSIPSPRQVDHIGKGASGLRRVHKKPFVSGTSAIAIQYLPSPLELLGDVGVNAIRPLSKKERGSKDNQKETKDSATGFDSSEARQQERRGRYDCQSYGKPR